MLIAAAPFVELRLAIPFGIAKDINPWQVFFLALIGNTIPILPLLIFLEWGMHRLINVKGIGKMLKWWFTKVEKKSKIVQSYGFWGLVFFVAIPLPGSGIWSGSVAATLLEFKKKRAFIAILLGMIIAGILVTLGSIGALKLWFICQ